MHDCIHQLLCGAAEIGKIGIHRDLKPENILFRKIGPQIIEIGISDFGCFCSHDDYQSKDQRVGTHAYLPPELVKCYNVSLSTTNLVDAWGIGICISFLCQHSGHNRVAHQITNLLDGLLNSKPSQRWSAEYALAYVERCLYKPNN